MNFVIIAGIPKSLERSFAAVREAKLAYGNRHIVWSPIDDSGIFSEEYISKLQDKFRSAIREKLPYDALANGTRISSTATLLVVERPDVGTTTQAALLKSFFPGVLAVAVNIPAAIDWLKKPNSTLAHIINKFVEEARRALCQVEKALPAVEKEITSRANKTCLLLPVFHFKSTALVPFFERIGAGILKAGSAFDYLRGEVKKFESQYLKTIKQGDGKLAFIDDRDMVFNGPGTALHAFVRDEQGDDGHAPRCFWAARYRLGAAFDPRFHYDCASNTGQTRRNWKSCHKQAVQLPAKRMHANISPNDAVR